MRIKPTRIERLLTQQQQLIHLAAHQCMTTHLLQHLIAPTRQASASVGVIMGLECRLPRATTHMQPQISIVARRQVADRIHHID